MAKTHPSFVSCFAVAARNGVDSLVMVRDIERVGEWFREVAAFMRGLG